MNNAGKCCVFVDVQVGAIVTDPNDLHSLFKNQLSLPQQDIQAISSSTINIKEVGCFMNKMQKVALFLDIVENGKVLFS